MTTVNVIRCYCAQVQFTGKQQFQRDDIFKQYLFNNNNSGKVQLNSYYYLKNLLAFLKKKHDRLRVFSVIRKSDE